MGYRYRSNPRVGGAFLVTDPEVNGGRQVEEPTFTCCHCNSVHDVKCPPERMNGFCLKCFAPMCFDCAKDGRCIPFMQKIEQYEEAHRQFERMGLAPPRSLVLR